MTMKQNALYWSEWSLAKKAGHLSECERHTIHIEALGEDKSHKDFANEDFDKVLAAFRAISRPTSLNSQVRQIEQPRTRLLNRIADQTKCLELFLAGGRSGTDYLRLILRDRFHVEQIDDLNDADLGLLRNTLSARLSMMRRTSVTRGPSGSLTEHEMCERAGVPCFRKPCARCRERAVPSQMVGTRSTASHSEEPELADNPF